MDVFKIACRQAQAYRCSVADRRVRPERDYAQMRADFAVPFPETGTPDIEVIKKLADLGEPGLMQVTHPRFFGWVMGGIASRRRGGLAGVSMGAECGYAPHVSSVRSDRRNSVRLAPRRPRSAP
ncbi:MULTISPECIES: hypothetical protein [Pseudosulfitobacter]|uniref:hypothetical protein n=1 Tax=Pseudosulfitobacter pseudonitzschiae TaxID=1402135 RepID=UPI001CD5A5D2|nr:hypothetical protein [Pseudosulfitobacter pseudonitzschiae]